MNDPNRLGKYLIQGVLGEGGMGVVYKGYDPQLARDVAIKTIRHNLLVGKAGQELRNRFSREAQAEGSLIHPNIVAVYEYQNDVEQTPFFVMEYVEGKCLKDYLSRGMHFNLDMAMHIVQQILSALAYSHKRGVVHRDIKPANIIWLEDDSIKIADFGIAKLAESEYTQTGQVLGTPQYASPEQMQGAKTDARSDLYSTAVVFYELVSGVKPFGGNALADPGRLEDVSFDKFDIGDPELFGLFKAMMRKALAKDPDKRFQSAEEFSAALRQLMEKSKELAQKPTALSASAKRWWLGGSSVLGLLLLVVAYFLSSPDRASLTEPLHRLAKELLSNEIVLENKPSLSPEQQTKVARLLKTGDLHLKVGRAIVPEGSNAFDAYQMVLEIDPQNQAALAGMASIQEKIFAQTKLLVERGKVDFAEDLLAHATRLFPQNQELQSLQASLESTSKSDSLGLSVDPAGGQ